MYRFERGTWCTRAYPTSMREQRALQTFTPIVSGSVFSVSSWHPECRKEDAISGKSEVGDLEWLRQFSRVLSREVLRPEPSQLLHLPNTILSLNNNSLTTATIASRVEIHGLALDRSPQRKTSLFTEWELEQTRSSWKSETDLRASQPGRRWKKPGAHANSAELWNAKKVCQGERHQGSDGESARPAQVQAITAAC